MEDTTFTVSDTASTRINSANSLLNAFFNKITSLRVTNKKSNLPDLAQSNAVREAYRHLIDTMGYGSYSRGRQAKAERLELVYWNGKRYDSCPIGYHTTSMYFHAAPVKEVDTEHAFTDINIVISDKSIVPLIEFGFIKVEPKTTPQILCLNPSIFSSLVPGVAAAAGDLVSQGNVLFDRRNENRPCIKKASEDPVLRRYITDKHDSDVYCNITLTEDKADIAIQRYVEFWARNLFENSFLKFTGSTCRISRSYIESICNYFLAGHGSVRLVEPASEISRDLANALVARECFPPQHQETIDMLIRALDIIRLWYVAAMDLNTALLFDGKILENETDDIFELLDDFKDRIGVATYEKAYWNNIPIEDILVGKPEMELHRRY